LSNFLSGSVAWLSALQKANCATPVSYVRGYGGPDPVTISIPDAVVGQTRDEVTDTEGFLVEFMRRGYLIDPAYFADLSPPYPIAGDRCVEAADSAGESVYEVAAIPGGDVWCWSDQYHVRMRVHTKNVSGS